MGRHKSTIKLKKITILINESVLNWLKQGTKHNSPRGYQSKLRLILLEAMLAEYEGRIRKGTAEIGAATSSLSETET
jgi:hypothetical protein